MARVIVKARSACCVRTYRGRERGKGTAGSSKEGLRLWYSNLCALKECTTPLDEIFLLVESGLLFKRFTVRFHDPDGR